MQFEACDAAAGPRGCLTVGEFQRSLIMDLQPLFAKYGVDVYNAGHVHSCECLPMLPATRALGALLTRR